MLSSDFDKITVIYSCQEARRIISERDFDIVIINTPLKDESGESLSRDIAVKNVSQVMLIVKSEFYDEVSAVVNDYGIITVEKPMNKTLFWQALKLARAAHSKVRQMEAENKKLLRKIEDIKIVDRAKYILISGFKMSENEAHKHIEKQAMDLRISKRAVAEEIINSYDS